MPGTVFDYEPGRVDARFRQDPEHDRIWVELALEGHVVTTTECDENWELSNSTDHPADRATCTVYMDSTFCPFSDFVRFLAAICTEVLECGFYWNAEGPSGEMKWKRGSLRDRTGFLDVSWYAGKDSFSHRVMVSTR